MGVVVRRYIDFLILLIPTPLVSVLFCSSIPTFCSFINCFFITSNASIPVEQICINVISLNFHKCYLPNFNLQSAGHVCTLYIHTNSYLAHARSKEQLILLH